jgi:hypothetical protein
MPPPTLTNSSAPPWPPSASLGTYFFNESVTNVCHSERSEESPHLSLPLSLPALVVILNAGPAAGPVKDPRICLFSVLLYPPKNKSQKSGVFFVRRLDAFSHHVFTTIHHVLTIQKPRSVHHYLQNPLQKRPSTTQKKSTNSRWPRNRLSDFEAIGLQTARKPNSVLDDHSSTRRITAAL